MFFVEHDDPYIFKRGEYCRSRADDDLHFAVSYAHPLVIAFALCQPAVEHRDRIAPEPADEPVDYLLGQ